MFIYPPHGQIWRPFTAVPPPRPVSPWGNAKVAGPRVVLRWQAGEPVASGDQSADSFEVQVAREMLFRPEDIVATQAGLHGTEWPVEAPLVADRRYHWRVRALDAGGNSTGWSRPQSFWYQAAPERAAATSNGDAPAEAVVIPRAQVDPTMAQFTAPGNLAQTGMPFAFPNYWEGPGEAVD